MSSIFTDLTTVPYPVKDERPPVTDLIQLLLKVVAHDVCSTSRNTMSFYLLVSKARDIAKHIHDLIYDVEINGKWESFESYSSLVQPLEDFLYNLHLLAEKEAIARLPSTSSVEFYITFAAEWEANRTLLRETFQSDILKGIQGSAAADVVWASRHDDITLINTLLESLEQRFQRIDTATALKKPRSYPVVRNGIPKFETTLYNEKDDTKFVIAMKFTMVIYGILEALLNQTSTRDQQRDLLDEKLWAAAKNVHDKLNEKTWLAFIKLLQSASPPDLLELINLAGKIRRPFHAQTITLVRYCHTILSQTKSLKGSELGPLKSAIATTAEALNAAIEVIADNTLLKFEVDTTKEAAAATKFGAAKNEIAACFKTFKMDDQAPKFNTSMANAKKDDDDWMNNLRQLLGKNKPIILKSEPTQQVKVAVKMRYVPSELESVSNEIYDGIDLECKLDILLSTVLAKIQSGGKKLPVGCYFGKPSASSANKLDRAGGEDKVKDLPVEAGNRVVHLIFKKT